MNYAIWSESDKVDRSQKKENLNELFDEFSKLTSEQDEDTNTGPPTEGDTCDSFFDVPKANQERPTEADVFKNMTEDWGDAVAFGESTQFATRLGTQLTNRSSGTLAENDILAAALRR